MWGRLPACPAAKLQITNFRKQITKLKNQITNKGQNSKKKGKQQANFGTIIQDPVSSITAS